MATMAALRTQAKAAGVSSSAIRSAESVKELEALIKRHGGGTKTSANGRRVVKKSKSVTKSKPVRKAATRTTGGKAAPAKGRSSSPAKRQPAATRKAAPKPKASAYEAKGGRNVLENVNYGVTEGWNARAGSAPDTIVKALRRFKGNREKVLNFLLPDIGDFVKPTRRNKTKWAKGEREKMLAYRIARTAWDFALKTGQHEKAENRVEYGTGGTGQNIWKPAKPAKKAAPAKRTAKATPKPKGRNSRPAARKPAAKATPARATRKPATPARKRAVRRSK